MTDEGKVISLQARRAADYQARLYRGTDAVLMGLYELGDLTAGDMGVIHLGVYRGIGKRIEDEGERRAYFQKLREFMDAEVGGAWK